MKNEKLLPPCMLSIHLDSIKTDIVSKFFIETLSLLNEFFIGELPLRLNNVCWYTCRTHYFKDTNFLRKVFNYTLSFISSLNFELWLLVYLASTMPRKNMNLLYSIRMYWTNFWQPTFHVQQNIFEKTLIEIGASHFYASFWHLLCLNWWDFKFSEEFEIDVIFLRKQQFTVFKHFAETHCLQKLTNLDEFTGFWFLLFMKAEDFSFQNEPYFNVWHFFWHFSWFWTAWDKGKLKLVCLEN